MNESDIQDFWNRYPCGDLQVGGLQQRRGDYEAFFNDYDIGLNHFKNKEYGQAKIY